MKKFLLATILVLVSVLSYSQITIGNGFLDDSGDPVLTTSNDLDGQYDWKLDDRGDNVMCVIYQGGTIEEVLSWSIISSEDKPDLQSFRYRVHSKDGRIFSIDFSTADRSVIIFNHDTEEFSIMSGPGLKY